MVFRMRRNNPKRSAFQIEREEDERSNPFKEDSSDGYNEREDTVFKEEEY
jgi:hypothetical protein